VLHGRYAHAREVLTLYRALLPVQAEAFDRARAERPAPEALAGWLGEHVLPQLVGATMAAGPEKLSQMVAARIHSADLGDLVGRWLRGEEQPAVDRYLARVTATPVLEALGSDFAAAVCATPPPNAIRAGRRCPNCGGLPQLSFSSVSGEPLVTAPRHLQCSRCSSVWSYSRMTCAGCGETTTSALLVLADEERFPHLRVDACEVCRTYLLTVVLDRDARAVPVVDELAAIPLDLYARERGFQKVTPNLMNM
jgi:FdhE protein